MNFIEKIENCIPDHPEDEIPWGRVDQLFSDTDFDGMKVTQQNPAFHGEGDVYTHTQMVCQELVRMPEFNKLPDTQKTELFLAAVLHDIGKVKTTRLENGNWTSPHHGLTGSQIARAFLWRDCGLCGTYETIAFRETVCKLIHHHMLPFHLLYQEQPERKIREAAAIGELAPDFSWNLLCMLAEADAKGRIADDIEDGIEQVRLARVMAEEAGCLEKPYHFPDAFTKHAYLSGRNILPNQALYDDTWGEVIMISGLPGTGKDTWRQQNHSSMPMISLDEIRDEFPVKPTDHQGIVVQAAQKQAREYLRHKESFIWNATNLTKDVRERLTTLFESYGARVRIVYLETNWGIRENRNKRRADAVPEEVVAKMLEKTALPEPGEAQTVEWLCV